MKANQDDMQTRKLSLMLSLLCCLALACIAHNAQSTDSLLKLNAYQQNVELVYVFDTSVNKSFSHPHLSIEGDNAFEQLSTYYQNASSAVYFKDLRQQALRALDSYLGLIPQTAVADDYLFSEPLCHYWFCEYSSNTHRISGWKDSNIQIKLLNSHPLISALSIA